MVCQQKGGPGKTTLASHLGVAAELTGARTAYIDCDPQGTLSEWWNAREAAAPALAFGKLTDLPATLAGLAAEGIKLVVLDTPPGIGPEIARLVSLATYCLIPVRPSPHDLRAVGRTVDIIMDADKPFGFVVNAVKPRSSLTPQAIALLSQHGPVAPALVGDRTEFAASMTDGRTCLETAPSSKGAEEIRALWNWIANQLNTTKRRRASRKGA